MSFQSVGKKVIFDAEGLSDWGDIGVLKARKPSSFGYSEHQIRLINGLSIVLKVQEPTP